ncbi:tetratricopeptide repeat protein [Streptomyces sp. NPDC059256]|uniref:tetratricopeptide repeat protein n=1 Tax=Streptomyces sp. NPDC059256 TaxID=3346794 RepID=UPI0036940C4C
MDGVAGGRRLNATIGALVAAALVGGVCAMAVGGGEAPPPAPGPVARAQSAAALGAPAALSDLDALIADRSGWLRKHPRDEESWAVLGTAQVERALRLADWDALSEAEGALERSLEIVSADAGNTEALLGLAALANARQDHTTARDWARQAQKQKPRRWTVYPVLIEAYTGLGDYTSVGKALETLHKLYAGSQARVVTARVYRDRGWREDASANAEDAVGSAEGAAEKAAALYALGELAWERGEPQEAIKRYDLALRLAPDHHPSLAARGRALTALGRTEAALRDYQSALAKRPLAEYALEAGELNESLGLDGDAETQYALVGELARKATAGGRNEELVVGRYEADHGDPQDAVELLQAEWDGGRRSIQIADALGWALFRAGRVKEALPYAKKATGEGLRSPLFAYHRGEIERASQRYGPARRYLGQALRINPHFSPLLAPAARDALDALGQPPPGGPRKVTGREGMVVKPKAGGGAVNPGGGGTPSGTGQGRGAGSGAVGAPPARPAAPTEPAEPVKPAKPAEPQAQPRPVRPAASGQPAGSGGVGTSTGGGAGRE